LSGFLLRSGSAGQAAARRGRFFTGPPFEKKGEEEHVLDHATEKQSIPDAPGADLDESFRVVRSEPSDALQRWRSGELPVAAKQSNAANREPVSGERFDEEPYAFEGWRVRRHAEGRAEIRDHEHVRWRS